MSYTHRVRTIPLLPFTLISPRYQSSRQAGQLSAGVAAVLQRQPRGAQAKLYTQSYPVPSGIQPCFRLMGMRRMRFCLLEC